MHIAPNEKIETFELDYDDKRDRWNGYDMETSARVIERWGKGWGSKEVLKRTEIKEIGGEKQ